MVGGLQYLCLTRLDIAFAVNKVSLYMHHPHDVHWTVVKQNLWYIQGTVDLGLIFQPSKVALTWFSEVD